MTLTKQGGKDKVNKGLGRGEDGGGAEEGKRKLEWLQTCKTWDEVFENYRTHYVKQVRLDGSEYKFSEEAAAELTEGIKRMLKKEFGEKKWGESIASTFQFIVR